MNADWFLTYDNFSAFDGPQFVNNENKEEWQEMITCIKINSLINKYNFSIIKNRRPPPSYFMGKQHLLKKVNFITHPFHFVFKLIIKKR